MVTSDRLGEVVKYLRFKGFANTQKEVAELLGMSPANLSSALRGDSRYLTDGLATKVCTNFIFINKDWLLTGEGEMLRDGIVMQNMYGDNQIAGGDITNGAGGNTTTTTNTTTNNYKDCGGCETNLLERAMEEIGEQRKLLTKAQEQIDRLLSIIEKMNDK
ncbi:hypothetical protein [Porphyromonas sp.]